MKLYETYEVFKKFENCRSTTEINAAFCETLGVYGVKYYFVGSIPPQGASETECTEHVLGSLLPDLWANRYFRHNFVHFDPTIHHVRTSNKFLNWKNIINSRKNSTTVMDDAYSIGMRQGVTVPQSSLDGLKIGISFSGDRLDLDNPTMETCMTVVGAYLVSALFKTENKERCDHAAELTNREKDVISWISEGYTSIQIGTKLSISTATVEKHYRQVLEKFNCKSRSHVIAEAIRQKFIA